MKKEVLNYRSITFKQIEEIVDIEKIDNDSKFDEWFAFNYKINNEELELLKKLIKKNKLFLSNYNETKLLVSFIAPILFSVDFNFSDIKDWYESWLMCKINGTEFRGKPDFMVAKGTFTPDKPYFFISEFKRSISDNNPEFQLLAEMLVATEINKTKIMYGCYIIGQHWFFMVLEKLENRRYEYFVSESFDCLKIKNLQSIYKNLQAAKAMFCKD